jgi:hypothetical protein
VISFSFINGFSQTDTLKPGEIKIYSLTDSAQKSKQDRESLNKKSKKYYNFISIQPMRFFVAEYAIFYERNNKKNRSTEIGVGYIRPSNNSFIWFIGIPYYTGDFELYGFSFYFSKKYYNSHHFYFSPEFIFRYEYNDRLEVNISPDHYLYSLVDQKRYIPSLSVKAGWKERRGIIDFYLGIGINERYVKAKYYDHPTQYSNKIWYDNGWCPFPLFRIGFKLGFPF